MNRPLFCVKLHDESPCSEIANELLTALELSHSTWHDREQGLAFHYLYAGTREEAQAAMDLVSRALPDWAPLGLKISRIEIIDLPYRDWAEAWKEHFPVQHVCERITIRPSWREYEPQNPDEIVIDLDPGMSFGTGRHATTRFCLREMAQFKNNESRGLLDAGCGSGILTVAAVKLGFSPVVAFDHDHACLDSTCVNLIRNHINPAQLQLEQADLRFVRLRRRFEVITANLVTPVLIRNAIRLHAFLQPGGTLIVAGILRSEFDKVQEQFAKFGLREIRRRSEDEWTGGVFRKC